MWQDSKLARWVHRVTDNSPRVWNDIPNDRVDIDGARKAVDKWLLAGNVCDDREATAARALLESGLEERPLNAIERAHAVLASVGVIEEVY